MVVCRTFCLVWVLFCIWFIWCSICRVSCVEVIVGQCFWRISVISMPKIVGWMFSFCMYFLS